MALKVRLNSVGFCFYTNKTAEQLLEMLLKNAVDLKSL